MESLRNLPQNTQNLLAQNFYIAPDPNPYLGLWIFRGEKFVKVKTGEIYVIDMAFFNNRPEVRNGVSIPVGWRYVFRHLGTGKVTDISSEVLRELFREGALARANTGSWPETEEAVIIKTIVKTIDFASIKGLQMNYGKSAVITDLAKYISSNMNGLASGSLIARKNSTYALVKLFKTLHAWPVSNPLPQVEVVVKNQ